MNNAFQEKDKSTWKPDSYKYECGQKINVEHIVGGTVARVGEFPYMALLGYNVSNEIQYGCGGSVINKWYVLTAAHCVHEELPK